MTLLEDAPPRPDVDLDATAAAVPEPAPDALRPAFVVGAASLAALAAAWMLGGLFRGGATPRLIAIAGVAIGSVLALASTRFPRGAAAHYLVVPVSAIVGAALVAPSATGGTANLPGLVQEALRAGGLLQPPVAFEPGWRFILVVLLAVVTSASVSAALTLRRPRLAVALPAPVVLGGALLQPDGAEQLASLVAGALLLGAMALAFGADLPSGESARGTFEVRRLARGGLLLLVVVGAMVGLSRAGFLFPEPDAEPVVPPQRPQSPPPEPDRVLFAIESERPGPWRVGVLDGYDGAAFLLPPLDPERFVDIEASRSAAPIASVDAGVGPATTVRFRAVDLRGGTLPGPPQPVAVRSPKDAQYDPRTQVLRLPSGRPPKDFTYEVTTPPLPDAAALASATPAPSEIVTEFTAAPPAPNEVVELLTQAPTSNAFDRLQFVRQRLYNSITAAGAGRPGEVTPAVVGSMFGPGAEATPYEITAAEVLLARWAGVPARIGFGFYGGDLAEGSSTIRTFRPRHGAAWLEAYFEGHGWVPLVGTPPKAKASLSDEEKRDDPNVTASQELAVVVYVPVELETVELLYQRVRRWAELALPLLALIGLVAAAWPFGVKALRRWRRLRWSRERGPAGRIWAAYADLRDRATDLNIGRPGLAPLEFLTVVAADEEHEELAWLVTRTMWGDLRRAVDDEDAAAAEEMSASVARRIARAQPASNRLAAAVSRASLRDPFDPALPGAGAVAAPPRPASERRAVLASARAHPRRVWQRHLARVLSPARRLARPRSALIASAVVVALVGPAFVPTPTPARAATPVALPEILPSTTLGYDLVREAELEDSFSAPGAAALVAEGRVYTIRKGSFIAGSFQVAVLREDVDGRDRAVQQQIESSLQTGAFTTRRYGPVRLRTLQKAEQVLWVWFPPDRNVVELVVLRADVEDGPELVRELVRQQLELPLVAPR